MNYVPRKKDNRKRHIIFSIFVFLCIFLVGYIVLTTSKHMQSTPQQKDFQICDYSLEDTIEKMKSDTSSVYTVSDYLFYGESLNLFHEVYQQGKRDDLGRKSIVLKNLCTDETITFTLEGYLDRQIDVSLLDEGVYSLYVMDGIHKKRLVYAENLQSDPFYTMTRNQQQNEVILFANTTYKGHDTVYYNRDLFLQVRKKYPEKEVYDVYLDPYGAIETEKGIITAGNANGLDEAKEMLSFAQLLKEELEQYGLRVKISRETPDEVKSYYGDDSIMKDAYDSHAKYYFQLGMNTQTTSQFQGMEIYHSNFVSPTLANQMMYHIKNETLLKPSNAYQWKPRFEGISAASIIKGEDGLEYDAFPAIRESGGKGTGASNLNALTKQNVAFAKEKRQGMYALSYNFIYLTNPKDVELWKKEKEQVAKVLAKTFVEQTKVEKR